MPGHECHNFKYTPSSPIDDWTLEQYYMMVFKDGLHIADVDYPETREGETFEYDIEDLNTGITTTYNGIFTNYDDFGEISLN